MIRVIIPSSEEFINYKEECKCLYESCQDKIHDTNSFDFICNNTFFYIFLDDKKLVGGIYYFVDEDKKLFLNGFAKRKMFKQALECLRLSITWFKCNIYAQAQNRASALCLLRCGFERDKENIFIYKNGASLRKGKHGF